jgi:hypothetical protein
MRFKPQKHSAHDILRVAAMLNKEPRDIIRSLNGKSDSNGFHHDISDALRSTQWLMVEWKDEILSLEEILDCEAGGLVISYLLILSRKSLVLDIGVCFFFFFLIYLLAFLR